MDISEDYSARQRGSIILETVEPDTYYFGSWSDVPVLEYLQLVEGKRKDVKTVNVIFTGPVEASGWPVQNCWLVTLFTHQGSCHSATKSNSRKFFVSMLPGQILTLS